MIVSSNLSIYSLVDLLECPLRDLARVRVCGVVPQCQDKSLYEGLSQEVLGNSSNVESYVSYQPQNILYLFLYLIMSTMIMRVRLNQMPRQVFTYFRRRC